ncbi:MAG: DHA2 family efflux MFS transporter permease subunit [SAR324 cluster bacterium]|nr:DHA2 family efflux MFS transporter permease subunit [SAR324 cluster bacterium]
MSEAVPRPTVNRWLLLVVVMVGTFLSILDTTIMNVGLPHIMTSFGSNVEHAKWVSTGFMIAAAVSMPLTGWLGRTFGYGTVYLGALALFTLGAVSSALSFSLDHLIFSRVIQGVGAGIVQPTSIAILTRTFPPEMRGRAFGIWSIGVMTAPSLGPTVGGLLIDLFNWRAVFIMSLTVGTAALVLSSAVLSRERDEAPAPFDMKGYLALATFLVSALLTVAHGQEEGWTSRIILLGGAVAVTSIVLFIVIEWDAEYPIMPLRLFRLPDFSLAMFLTVYRSLGLFGAVFLLPIFLMQVQGRDPLEVGLLMMPGSIVMAFCSPIAGMLTDRFGGRWPAVGGVVSIALSLYLHQSLDELSSTWQVIYPQLFRGLGIALVMTPVVTTGMNAVAREDTGYASWMLNLSQRGSGAFAISILSSLLHRQVIIQKDLLGASAMASGPTPRWLKYLGITMGYSSIEVQPAMRAVFGRQLGKAATTLAFQNIFFLASAFTITALVPAVLINRFGGNNRKIVK